LTSTHSLAELKDGSLNAPPPSKPTPERKASHDAVEHAQAAPRSRSYTRHGLFGAAHTLGDIAEDDEGAVSQPYDAPAYHHGQVLDPISEEDETAVFEPDSTLSMASSSVDFFAQLSAAINANRSPEDILQEIARLA
jgi:hypothetical protein